MNTLARVVLCAVVMVAALPARATSVRADSILIELVTPGGPLAVRGQLYVPSPGLVANPLVGRLPTEPFLELLNGDEGVRADAVRVRHYAVTGGRTEVLEAEFGDNVLRWEVTNANGSRFGTGEYVVQRRGEVRTVPLTVRSVTDRERRFEPLDVPEFDADRAERFGGRWSVQFETNEKPSVGVFEVDADTGRATGTFLNATGDFRFLEGRADGGTLRLSAFDGQHAFLFTGELLGPDGIRGHFWSGNWWHETWTATRDADAMAPDGFDQTVATVERLTPTMLREMAFDVASGGAAGASSAIEALPPGEPRLLYIFGSWCPNCRDATETVKELADRYGGRGLRVAGLAFEHDTRRAATLAKAYADRNMLEFPVLVGGLSDKAVASERVPFLDKVRSYPTMVFIARDGTIEAVHSGFAGPATGQAHADQNTAIETAVRRIVR